MLTPLEMSTKFPSSSDGRFRASKIIAIGRKSTTSLTLPLFQPLRCRMARINPNCGLEIWVFWALRDFFPGFISEALSLSHSKPSNRKACLASGSRCTESTLRAHILFTGLSPEPRTLDPVVQEEWRPDRSPSGKTFLLFKARVHKREFFVSTSSGALCLRIRWRSALLCFMMRKTEVVYGFGLRGSGVFRFGSWYFRGSWAEVPHALSPKS